MSLTVVEYTIGNQFPGEVRGDLSIWPFFKAFWVSGADQWRHNPIGVPPKGEMKHYIQVAGLYT